MGKSSGSTTTWWWILQFSGRASPCSTKEEEELGGEEGCTREGVWLPSLSLTIYRGKGEEEAP